MGYLLLILVVLLTAVLLLPVLGRKHAARPQGGTLESDHPVSRTEPAADEPTPGASGTVSDRQQENARRRTPPA